ncbi:MAG: DNA polymerase I [Clostridium sp.]|nr:DNA polymerase I [Acetatifactor muris]MCM1527729.1 DNA polymerase I [Bacteroides sp.]MCM1563943.1 DNA polymerase I [Clostridium sp.]
MEKIVLIDGHSILNRAFYGVPDLSNAEGLHTNAIFGFLNIMFKILEEEQPEYLAVAFDVHAPTFRHEMYKDYKGTRKPMPEELREQVPVMKEVLQAMNVVIVEQAGLEADDILGTLAKKAERDGLEVSLVSGDRDLLQIASEHIKIRIPKTKRNGTEVEDYYAADVLRAYQVTPEQFIDVKALMGDTADNIPGVPKVGEKTATALIAQYGSLDNLYAHVEEVSKNAIRESLKEHKDLAELSRTLATIRTDCELEPDYEAARTGDYYTPQAYTLFKKLEFKNMLGRFDRTNRAAESDPAESFARIANLRELKALAQRAEKLSRVGLYALQEDGRLLGVAISLGAEETFFYVPVRQEPAEGQLSLFEDVKEETDETGEVRQILRGLSARTRIATFDIKREYGFLSTDGTERYFDVLIGAYLLNPLKNDYDIESVAAEHLGMMILGRAELLGKRKIADALAEIPGQCMAYCGYGALVSLAAADILEQKLADVSMDSLMREVEMPLSLVLYDMEQEGIEVRKEELRAYGEALVGRIEELEESIHRQAGEQFNINSPKQLGEILFERLKLPGGKKTKTGYSTAADVLEKLSEDHPIVKDILEYRGLVKLKSTYADGLAVCIGEDGRIHSNFNQTITATGRISSTEPNLQNIPTRTELGKQLRKVFVPREGFVFMDADYSQIELRVLAHMSGDEQLIEAYHMDEDIHRITASKVFHTPFEEVTDLQRRNAKAVNFGIVYGISSFGLSQDLSISRGEAAEYIEQYFATYPGIKTFLDTLVRDAKEKGYAVTMFHRRRPVPELASSNFMQRSFGERVAMNSPIQGTAADIIKIAMIKVWEALRRSGLRSKLILQVHDELLIETAEDEVEQVREILTENMKSAAELAVTLEVDVHTGANWYEAK